MQKGTGSAIIIATMDTKIATTNGLFLQKLIQKQGDQSDYAFARMIGVKRSLWQLTRTGKLPIGVTVLKAIVQIYPELNADVLDYLRGENHDDSNEVK